MRKVTYLSVAAAALLALSVFTPQAAFASGSSTHPRVATLLASNDYVVYKEKTTNGGNISNNQFTGGSVYAVNKSGKRQSLPGFTNSGNHFLYLNGDILVQATNSIHNTAADHQNVRYLNLKTGAHGTYTYSVAGASLVGAAPTGWIMEQTTNVDTSYGTAFDLVVTNPAGTTKSLGTPFLDGRGYSIQVSDSGIISTPGISDETPAPSQVRYMTWASAGYWKTLYTTKGGDDTGIACTPPSTTVTACSLIGADSVVKTGLVSLSGKGARWIQDTHPSVCSYTDYTTHGNSLWAIETSNSGVCTTGKLFRFTWTGNSTTLVSGSSHHYSAAAGITTGLGKVLISSIDQRHIDTLVGVTKSPCILVKV